MGSEECSHAELNGTSPGICSRFEARLNRIIEATERLLDEPLALPEARGEQFMWAGGERSLERTGIWESVFHLWIATGKSLGTSRSGPVHRVISILHAALSLPAPDEETVYVAIRQFKSGALRTGHRAVAVWEEQSNWRKRRSR
jgi:hypothetical protein